MPKVSRDKEYVISGKCVLEFCSQVITAKSKKEAVEKFLNGEYGIDNEEGYNFMPRTFRTELMCYAEEE